MLKKMIAKIIVVGILFISLLRSLGYLARLNEKTEL